jgi:hypothetical protein
MFLAFQPHDIPREHQLPSGTFSRLSTFGHVLRFFLMILAISIGAEADLHVKITVCDEWLDATTMTKSAKRMEMPRLFRRGQVMASSF